MKVVDDVLVLADMQSHQFFVGDRLGFDILGSVRILQSVDGLLELGTGRTDVHNHHSFAIATQ